MKTLEDTLREAAGSIRGEAAKMPDRTWHTATRRAPLGVLVAVGAAALVVAVIGIPALLTAGGNDDVAGDIATTTGRAEGTDDAISADPELPEDTRYVVTQDVPGYGEFTLLISGRVTEVIEGETVVMTCLHVVPPTVGPDRTVIPGGVSMCGPNLSPTTFGIWVYTNCDETNRSGTGVMSILGLDTGVPNTVQLALDNGETVEVTTDDLAAVLAWDAPHTLTGVAISGRSAEEIASAIDLPIDPCG
jgi:hypothetical protein